MSDADRTEGAIARAEKSFRTWESFTSVVKYNLAVEALRLLREIRDAMQAGR